MLLAQVPFPDWGWLANPRSWERLAGYALDHVQLVVFGLAVGVAMAAPLVLLAIRRPALHTPLLAFTGVLYTIPSLALFLFIMAFLGTGASATTAVIGLGIYSLLILFRNAVAGLEGVPAEVREAGEAMGYTPSQLLLRVELPIALPVIIAGLRIATVTLVGLTTISALIGVDNLGRLFIQGFQRQNPTILLVAIVVVVVLAFLADLVLLLIQRLALPWSRARETA